MIDLPNGWRVVCFLEVERDCKYRMTLKHGNRMHYVEAQSELALRKVCKEFAKTHGFTKTSKYQPDIDCLKRRGVIEVSSEPISQAIRAVAKKQYINISSRKAVTDNGIVYILTRI